VTKTYEKILVIRLGALGDLVFCFQSFEDIRRAHPNAEIALLTRAPFAPFAKSMPWFDKIMIDTHPTYSEPGAWVEMVGQIMDFGPNIVYDLQGKTRQTILYTLLGGIFGPVWSGAAPFCTYPRLWPPTPGMHFTEFLAAQLRAASVPQAPPVDLSWLDAPIDSFNLPENYAVIIAGCSPGALHKRWGAQNYAALAHALQARGIACIAVGTGADAAAVAEIKSFAPDIIDLCGKTSLFELAGILRRASAVIGNDTGPVHMAAAVGAPTLALFSGRSNPAWSKPPGKRVEWRQRPSLDYLDVGDVIAAFDSFLQHPKGAGR
jgi:ADP-heptose:LPS heptosyltransferase